MNEETETKKNHIPARYEGRSWDELSTIEKEAAIIAFVQNQELVST